MAGGSSPRRGIWGSGSRLRNQPGSPPRYGGGWRKGRPRQQSMPACSGLRPAKVLLVRRRMCLHARWLLHGQPSCARVGNHCGCSALQACRHNQYNAKRVLSKLRVHACFLCLGLSMGGECRRGRTAAQFASSPNNHWLVKKRFGMAAKRNRTKWYPEMCSSCESAPREGESASSGCQAGSSLARCLEHVKTEKILLKADNLQRQLLHVGPCMYTSSLGCISLDHQPNSTLQDPNSEQFWCCCNPIAPRARLCETAHGANVSTRGQQRAEEGTGNRTGGLQAYAQVRVLALGRGHTCNAGVETNMFLFCYQLLSYCRPRS